MLVQSGIPLVLQQLKALIRKNALLSWRHKTATCLQLYSSFVFIFLMFCVQKAIDSRVSTSSYYKDLVDPQPRIFPHIPHNPMHFPGALHFVDENNTVISYGNQTNSASVPLRGHFKFQIPLQIAAEREISRTSLGDDIFEWFLELKEFSAVGSLGPTFFLAVAMFGFVFQMNALVSEKELKLRQAMEMMGLYESAYWMSWLAWESIVVLISSLFTVLFGMLFQLDFFLRNNFAVLFFTFFLFQLNMTSAAFMLSAFCRRAMSTTSIGFYGFHVGIVPLIVTQFGFPYSSSFSSTARFIWSLFPPNLLAEAITLLQGATSTPQDPGVSWSGRLKCTPGDSDCVVTINQLYIWLISTFFLWFVLAIYFDSIIPNPYGVRKSTFYFLRPGYWTGKSGYKVEGGICSCVRSTPDDEDVLEEENSVEQQQANEGDADPGTRQSGCCKCKRTSALKGIWLNFPKDQLFCLLGPNGAGKTKIINCLTGIRPVTAGDDNIDVLKFLAGLMPVTAGDSNFISHAALVYGYSIGSSIGMTNIRRRIGVCPQFDILWDVLSGEEHLYLFASIKGVWPAYIGELIKQSLEEVGLTDAARMRVSSYSGGMKRRLSVAIALIGDPKLIILDEPTTGMDPISRRRVWDIIIRAKRWSAIVLTTQSMEEAHVLGNRIGNMAEGRLRCTEITSIPLTGNLFLTRDRPFYIDMNMEARFL